MMKPIDIIFLTIGGSLMFVGLFIMWPLFFIGLIMVTWALVSHFGSNGGSGPNGPSQRSGDPYGRGYDYPYPYGGQGPYLPQGSPQGRAWPPQQSYPMPPVMPPAQDQRYVWPGQSRF